VVIVHTSADGTVALPVTAPGEVGWVLARDAVRDLRRRIGRPRRAVSRDALAVLVAGTQCPLPVNTGEVATQAQAGQ
jgi:hypothetical protein